VVWKYTTLISKLLVVAPGQRRRRSVLFVIRVLFLFIVLSSAAVALVLGVPRITKELTGWKVCADESSQFGDMRNIGNVHLAYKTVMEEQAQRDLNEVSSAKGLLTSTLVCWVFYSINAAICLVNIFVRRSGFAENKAADRVLIHVDTDKSDSWLTTASNMCLFQEPNTTLRFTRMMAASFPTASVAKVRNVQQ
jgi:hypothetical protein